MELKISDDEDNANPDKGMSIHASNRHIKCDEEYSDSEDEGDGRKDNRNHKSDDGKSNVKVEGDQKPAESDSKSNTQPMETDVPCKKDTTSVTGIKAPKDSGDAPNAQELVDPSGLPD